MSHRVTAVHSTGNPEFPRFIIGDNRGEVWTGESWSPDSNYALLYANPRHVSVDCANLQRQETVNKPHLLTATIPVRIEAFGDQPLDPEVLKLWLYKVLSLEIGYGSGSGPTPDSIVLPSLMFSEWAGTSSRLRHERKETP